MDSDEKSLSPPSDISSPHSSSANTSTPSIPSSSSLLFSSSHEKNILIIQSLIQYSEYLKEICSDPQFPLASSPTIPILQSLEKYLFTLVHGSETFLLCETLKELRQNIYHSTSMVRAQSFHTPVQHSLQRQSSDEELRAPQTTCETSEGEDHVILSPIPYHISSFAFETPPQSPISPTLEDTGCLPSTPSSLRNFEMNSFLATSLSDDDNGISPQRSEGYGSTKDENCVEGLEEDDAEQSDDEKGKKNKRLNKSATAQLTKWLLDHLDKPFPSQEEKAAIAVSLRLTPQQVGNWMTNMRKRHVYPIISGKKRPKTSLDHTILDRHSRLPKHDDRRSIAKGTMSLSSWRSSPNSSASSTPSPSLCIRTPSPLTHYYPRIMPAPFPRHLPQHKPTFPPRLIPVPSSDREAANLSKCDSTPPQCGPPIVFNERKRRLEEEEDSSTSQKACRHDTPSSRDRSDSDDWHELLSTLIPQHDFKSDDIWHGELLSADELREIQWTKEI